MLKPSYKVQVGSEVFEPSSPCLISVRVVRSMDVPAGFCEILLNVNRNKSSKIKEGDEILIQLGYEKNLKDVFSGFVDNLENEISRMRILGLDPVIKLLSTRVNQVYEGQTAGRIVSDLAERADVKVKGASEGLRFPSYTVDNSRNVYEHMRELADKCGFDLYMNVEGELIFKRYERREPHVFEYGKNIIHIDVEEYEPYFTQASVRGESPASFKGADKAHWLTKRIIEGTAGSGNRLLIGDPTIRDRETADRVAEAILNKLTRTFFGTLKTIGKADIDLGDTIELRSLQQSSINGEYQVRSVEHVLNRKEGFITIIGFRKY